MDLLPLPSVDLDELMKLDSGALNLDPIEDPFLQEFAVSSPTAVLYPPSIALPGDPAVPFHSSEGSGASRDSSSPTHAGTQKPAKLDPKERIRAKNRRAQSRYREKQKVKRKETEDALNQAIAEVERMKLQNEVLGEKVLTMEKVLTFRDHAANLLETSKAEEEKKGQPAQLKLLDKLLPTAPPLPSSKGAATGIKEIKDGAEDEHHEIDGMCPLQKMSRMEIMTLKASGHQTLEAAYKELAEELTDVLKELEDPRASPHSKKTAEDAMVNILMECGCMCFEYAILQPTSMQQLLAVSIGDGFVSTVTATAAAANGQSGSNEVVDSHLSKYIEITRTLQLSNEQRERLQPLREVFLQRAERIASNRRRILSKLHAAMPMVAEGNPVQDLHALNNATSNWLGIHSASQELEANIQEEHVASMEFISKTFGGVFTKLQKAKAIVAAYPAFPDVFAIATAALMEHQAEVESGGSVGVVAQALIVS